MVSIPTGKKEIVGGGESSGQAQVVENHLGEEGLKDYLWIRKNYLVEGISCVDWTNDRNWFLPPRRVWDSFFLLVVQGRLRVRLGKREVDVGPGEVLCLPDGERHEIRSTGGPLRQLAFHAHINNDVGEPLLHRFSAPVHQLRHPDDWVRQLQGCTQWMEHDQRLGRERLGHLLWLFLQELLESGLTLTRTESSLDDRVERAMGLLRKSLAHDWSMPEISRAVGLGSARFRALFCKSLGIGPKAWLMKKRMEKGAEHLMETRKTVVQVARTVGYSDEHHFQRSFKRWSGLTPTEFRNRSHL